VEESPTARLPEKSDLIKICAALNDKDARYIVVGGMAVIHQGFLRATDDIDLLLLKSPENIAKVREALEVLPDKAIRQAADDIFDETDVLRVGDEIVVDLMMSACGIRYEEAESEIEFSVIDHVPIPFASAKLLLRMKQTYREKHIPDRIFLQEKLTASKAQS
jgi:hypothetical protein